MDYELVDRYFEAVEEEQALADSTLRTYAYAIRDFCRHLEKLGAASLDEVAKSDVFDYVRDQMDRGISASTINTRLVALKSLFRHLHAYGLIDANPMSKFGPRRPAAHNSTSPRSVDYIISYLNGMPQTTPLGIRNRALAEIIFGSALTVKQLVSLNVDDLSLGRRAIISTRQFLSDESCFWLARYLGQVREPLARKRAPEGANVEHDNALFLSRTGRRLLGRDVARALRKSEKGPMTATTLRLSLPFILIAHGMSPLAVNKFMGWSPSRIRLVLEIYDCMNPPEAVRIVQRRLGSSAGDVVSPPPAAKPSRSSSYPRERHVAAEGRVEARPPRGDRLADRHRLDPVRPGRLGRVVEDPGRPRPSRPGAHGALAAALEPLTGVEVVRVAVVGRP